MRIKDEVLEYLPAAWFPARVAVALDDKTLYVANAKGFGAGPNGGPDFHVGPEGAWVGDITKGLISIIPLDAAAQSTEDTFRVVHNNGTVPPSVSTPAKFEEYLEEAHREARIPAKALPPTQFSTSYTSGRPSRHISAPPSMHTAATTTDRGRQDSPRRFHRERESHL